MGGHSAARERRLPALPRLSFLSRHEAVELEDHPGPNGPKLPERPPVEYDYCPTCGGPRSFTCPRCGETTFNILNVAAGYCPDCGDWTGWGMEVHPFGGNGR